MAARSKWPVLRTYEGENLQRIALPLGGIGTGTVSLGGRGNLCDWEVMNRPAKGYVPGPRFSGAPFLCLRAQAAGKPPVTRLQCGVSAGQHNTQRQRCGGGADRGGSLRLDLQYGAAAGQPLESVPQPLRASRVVRGGRAAGHDLSQSCLPVGRLGAGYALWPAAAATAGALFPLGSLRTPPAIPSSARRTAPCPPALRTHWRCSRWSPD